MSAYVVEKKHISYLLDSAMSGKIGNLKISFSWFHNGQRHYLKAGDYDKAATVGQMLWDENVKSVRHRYPNEPKENLPGYTPDNPYRYGKHEGYPMHDFKIFEVSQAIRCYMYQTSESPDWKESESYAFCMSLKDSCLAALPGVDNSEWGQPKRYGSTANTGIRLTTLIS